MKKMVVFLSLLLALTLAVGGALAEVTLSFVHEHTPELAQTINSSAGFCKVRDEFLLANPDIKLDETTLGNTETWEKLLALAAADELPDIVYLKYSWMANLCGNGMLAPITKDVDPSQYRDNLYSLTYDGEVYALPTKYTVYNMVFYNEKLWKEAGYDTFPTTWADLLKANEYFKSKGIATLSFGNKGQWFACSNYFTAITYEVCGEDWVNSILANDGNAKFTDACFIEALNDFKSLTPLYNDDFNMQDDMWAVSWYLQGKAAATVSGTWTIGNINKSADEYPDVAGNTRIATVPAFTQGYVPYASSATSVGVGINAKLIGTDKYDAALKFVQWMGGPEYSEFMASKGEMGPAIVPMPDTTDFNQIQKDFLTMMEGKKSAMDFNTYIQAPVFAVMSASIQNLLGGNETAEQVAADIQAAQDAL